MKSAKIYNWRGQKSVSSDYTTQSFESLWKDETNREGIKKYKINKKHPIIKQLLDSEKENKLFSLGKIYKISFKKKPTHFIELAFIYS